MSTAELIEQLRSVDEVLLLELLELTSTDIVDAFTDEILLNEDRIRRYLSHH